MRWIKTKTWPLVGLPLAFYTLAVLFITWPLVTQLSTHLAGGGFADSVEYVRLGWWGKYALQNGLNPFYQSLFGYPEGFLSTIQLAQPLIYWPIALLSFMVSPVTAFNLWLMIETILSGLAAYWLCRVVLSETKEAARPGISLAALVGGLIFMASPAVQGHLNTGHVNPLSNYALPVVLLCLFLIVERSGGWRVALIGALALLILALGNFTFPIFTLLPILLFGGIYKLLTDRVRLFSRPVRWRLLRDLAVMLGGGALLILPFYLPLIGEALPPDRPAYLRDGGWVGFSTDPLAFVTFSPFTTWGQFAPAFSRTILGTNSTEGSAYLGVVAVILAGVALLRRRRRAVLWLTIALGCMLFSLGPMLKWMDQPVTYALYPYHSYVVLPWALFQDLPLINVTRTPGRFNITTGLALGVLAALGLAVLLPRIKRAWLRPAVTAVLIVLILLEYQLFFPFLTTPAALPAYFDKLASRSDVRAVFDVPWYDPSAQKAALYQQTVHHKALMAGYISRRTPVDPARLSLLSDVAVGKAQGQAAESSALSREAIRSILKANGVDVVIYHWDLLDRAATLRYAGDAFGPPAYQDDHMAIFEVPDAAPFSPDTSGVPITFSQYGWWRDSEDPNGPTWITNDAYLYLYTPESLDRQWSLRLSPLLMSRRLQLAVDGQVVQAWQVNPPTTIINFGLRLAPGFHALKLILPDGCVAMTVPPRCLLSNATACTTQEEPADLCTAMALHQIKIVPAGAMALQDHTVNLSDGLSLRGYRLPAAVSPGERFTVETDWHAAERLPGDYHLFVHVLDQTGKPVAQYDGVPGQNTYPTTGWAVPQDWIESVPVDLPSDLPAGTYSLFTGWYRYPDLTRLGVEGNARGAQDGLVYLGDITVRQNIF